MKKEIRCYVARKKTSHVKNAEISVRVRYVEVKCVECDKICIDYEKKQVALISDKDTEKPVQCPQCERVYVIDNKIFKASRKKTKPIEKNEVKRRGRRLRGDAPRENFQTTLDRDTITVLKELPIDASQLFEQLLLEHCPGFVEALQRIRMLAMVQMTLEL